MEDTKESKESYESYKLNRRRKNREAGNIFVTIVICLIALASLTGCIFLILEDQQLKNDAGEFIAVMGPIEDGVFGNQEDSVRNEPGDLRLADEVLDELRERVSAGEDMSAILRALFVDDIVVGADGRFHFFPINRSLKMHEYEPERFVMENGILSYTDEDGYIISQKGIDVSRYQTEIDWERVAADGVDFAIIRVGFRGSTEGGLILDTYYEENIEGALAAGIDVGVYFFTQALNIEEAIEEAEFVLEHIAGFDITYPVVIDIEAINTTNPRTHNMTQSEWTDVAIAFCERVKQAGYTPMIYGNLRSFMIMLDMERLEEYEKWFAFFRTPIYFPYAHSIWQYTEKGRVDGIEGDVDLNVGFKRSFN